MIIQVKAKNDKENPLEDILDAILSLDEKEFNRLIQHIKYDELSFYYDDRRIEIPLSTVLQFFNKQISSNFENNSPQSERITSILNLKNEERFCGVISEESNGIDDFEFLMVKKALEILGDDELFKKFKDFDANKENFRLPNALEQRSQKIQNYLRVMISIFGNINAEGELENSTPILEDFYIPNIEKYKNRFMELYKIYEPQAKDVMRKLKCRFEFYKVNDTVLILDEEPEWQLNDEIKTRILKEMPEDMSPEEKAIFIYFKMCQLFAYDEGYLFREQEHGNKTNYTAQFSKEHLESITPNSRITCFDFCRIYKKIIDSTDELINAVVLTQGINDGHFYIGFATERCQATLEAINMTYKARNTS